jgi:hypothetical protein
MKTISVEIKGITPLLQNRFIQADIEGKSKKKAGAEKDKNIEDKLYLTPDGKIYQPSTHIFGCLVNAGKNFQIKGKRKSTYSKLFGSSLNIKPDAIVHKIQKWVDFTTTTVNPSTRGRMIVSRPMFNEWSLAFDLEILDEDIPEEVVKEALDYGGRYVGIGDWRPDKKGKYGQFIVTKFEEVQ